MKLGFTLACVLFFIAQFSYAQRFPNYISGEFTPGFLLAHRSDIKNLAAHNFGLQFVYEEDASNTNWGKYYKKPIVGFGLQYYNLGKKETGHAFGGLVTFKFNLIEIQNTDVKFRMGAGLAMLSKQFDVYNNKRNQAIGSSLNGSMQFALLFHRPFPNINQYINYGIGISHYSNGAYRVPNLGYNIPSIFLKYGFGLKGRNTLKDELLDSNLSWKSELALIYGKKQRNFANPVDFHNVGLQMRAVKMTNAIRGWRLGLDAALDKTYKYTENPLIALDSIKLTDQLELGVAAGYQWRVDKIDVIAELGAYFYKPAVLKNTLYQRIGIRYNLGERIKLSSALKFDRGVADYFEFGIGYRILN